MLDKQCPSCLHLLVSSWPMYFCFICISKKMVQLEGPHLHNHKDEVMSGIKDKNSFLRSTNILSLLINRKRVSLLALWSWIHDNAMFVWGCRIWMKRNENARSTQNFWYDRSLRPLLGLLWLQIGCWSKAVKGRVRNLLKKDIRRGRTLGRSL